MKAEKVSGGNPLSVETGENHEKIVFKTSKFFVTKMHYVGNVEFYKHASLQVETQNCFAAMKMTNSTMNSSCTRYYLLLILSFLLLLIFFEFARRSPASRAVNSSGTAACCCHTSEDSAAGQR